MGRCQAVEALELATFEGIGNAAMSIERERERKGRQGQG